MTLTLPERRRRRPVRPGVLGPAAGRGRGGVRGAAARPAVRLLRRAGAALPRARPRLLRRRAARRRRGHQPPAAGLLLRQGRGQHPGHADRPAGVLRLADQHGRPAARQDPPDRLQGVHAADAGRRSSRASSGSPASWSTRRWRGPAGDGTFDLVRRRRGAAPAAGHLRPDGHPRGRPRHGVRRDQRHPVRRRPGVRRQPGRGAHRVPDRRRELAGLMERLAAERLGDAHRRPHLGPGDHRGGRRAADAPGDRVVLHPAVRRGQRDHAQRDHARRTRAVASTPTSAPPGRPTPG